MKIGGTKTITEEVGILSIDGEDVGRLTVETGISIDGAHLDSKTGLGTITYVVEPHISIKGYARFFKGCRRCSKPCVPCLNRITVARNQPAIGG